jgi:hypothetical protein
MGVVTGRQPISLRPRHLPRNDPQGGAGVRRAARRRAEANAAIHAERVLELGVGTGQTSRRVLDLPPEAELVGIDESVRRCSLPRPPTCPPPICV